MDKSSPFNMFFSYLQNEKNASSNTIQAYRRDLNTYFEFLSLNSYVPEDITDTHIEQYKLFLKERGKAVSSVSRALSSIRAFYSFLLDKGVVSSNPAKSVHNDKMFDRKFEILSAEEIDLLIAQANGKDAKAYRDKALLELIYATGMKVSEIVSLTIDDYNSSVGYIRCRKARKERYIPLYTKAKKLLDKYIKESRPRLISDFSQNALFVNCNGEKLTRQGICKIIKIYASDAGIEKEISPNCLRHSFAAHLLINGAEVEQLQNVLGHVDINTTSAYVDYLKKKTVGKLMALHPHS